MQALLTDLKRYAMSQLDLTVRLANVNCTFAERLIAAHVAAVAGSLQQLVDVQDRKNNGSGNMLSVTGGSVMNYCNSCMREGFAYQQQVLTELSHRGER